MKKNLFINCRKKYPLGLLMLLALTFLIVDARVEKTSLESDVNTTKTIEKSTIDESTQTHETTIPTEERSTGEEEKEGNSLGESTESSKGKENGGEHLEVNEDLTIHEEEHEADHEAHDISHEENEKVNEETSNNQQMFESNEIPKPKYPIEVGQDSVERDEKHEENEKNEENDDVKNQEIKEENNEQSKEKNEEETKNDGKENIKQNNEEEIQNHFNDLVIMENEEKDGDDKEENKKEVNEEKKNEKEVNFQLNKEDELKEEEKNKTKENEINEENKKENEDEGKKEEKKEELIKIEENLPKVINETVIANNMVKGEHKSPKKAIGFWQRITCLLIHFNCPIKNEKKDKIVEKEAPKLRGVRLQPQNEGINVEQNKDEVKEDEDKNIMNEVDELGSLEKEHDLSVENLEHLWNGKDSIIEGMQHFNATMKFGATFIKSEIDKSGKQHSNITQFNAEMHN